MSKSLPEKEMPAATVFTLGYSLFPMIIRMMWSVKDVIALHRAFALVEGHPAITWATGQRTRMTEANRRSTYMFLLPK